MFLNADGNLLKIEAALCWNVREYYVFSDSLTGIVKSPLFKSWIRVFVLINYCIGLFF